MLQLIIKHCSYFLYFIIFQSIVFAKNSDNIEPWISADDLNNIKINMTIESVKNELGEPLFIESINDDDIIITKFIYSFRTKAYNKEAIEKTGKNIASISPMWGKRTNIQFVFTDNTLTSWEEDKLTLSMAKKVDSTTSSSLTIINILLNIVVITLNAAVLLSL